MRRTDLGVGCACLMLVGIAVAVWAQTDWVFEWAAGVTVLLQGGAITCFLLDRDHSDARGSLEGPNKDA